MIIDVAKVIRVLGYIVYTALWLPVIVLYVVVTPLVWIAMHIRAGLPIREAVTAWTQALMNGIRHDICFIQTGEW